MSALPKPKPPVRPPPNTPEDFPAGSPLDLADLLLLVGVLCLAGAAWWFAGWPAVLALVGILCIYGAARLSQQPPTQP